MVHGALIQVAVVFLTLAVGYFTAKIASRILIKLRRGQQTELGGTDLAVVLVEGGIIVASIVLSLFYLGFSSWYIFQLSLLDTLPRLLKVVLLLILGVFGIRAVVWVVKELVVQTGLAEQLEDVSGQDLLSIILLILKIMLYLLLIHAVVDYAEIPRLEGALSIVSYPLVFLLFLVLFVALLNPVRDYSAGFYLKNIYRFRPGNIIMLNRNEYEIGRISALSTELRSSDGSFVTVPNRVLAGQMLSFKRPAKEIETLEQLKETFKAQLPSMCGPACMQMALAMFKIPSDQAELAKLMGSIPRQNESQKIAGTHPKQMIDGVRDYTKGQVNGVWIGYDKIFDLKKEVKSWLSDGGVVVADYQKKYLFPKAKRAHYSLVIGVRSDEFLMVDPSSKSGGVYYSDYRDVAAGMDTYSELVGGKRGYLVVAPKGSAAYRRIEEGLVYMHPSMYRRLTKQLEAKVNKLTSSVTWYETIPEFIRKSLKDYEKDQVDRVWKPE